MSKLRIRFIAIHSETVTFMVEEDVDDVMKLLEGVTLISLYRKAKENSLKTEL